MALLGNLTGSSQFFNTPPFYNGVATQSLRLNAADNAFVSKTFGSGSQRTWTWSGWVKRSVLGSAYCYTQVTSGSDVSWLYFNASDQLNMQNYEGANQVDIKTNAKFRDISAWYHVMAVLDTTQSTNTDRAKMYVNGELQTSLASTTYPSQNADLKIGSGDAPFIIGGTPDSYGTGAGYKFDGYFAEVNFVDGTALDPTYFGETKNGVWIPKKYTGSYGTNGFRLEFKQTGTGTASASTIGADTSGEGNHLTSTNLVASDSNMPDSPENSFATMNPLKVPTSNLATLSEGNLKCVGPAPGTPTVLSTMAIPTTGKWYAEFERTAQYNGVGIVKDSIAAISSHAGVDANGYVYYDTGGNKYNNNSSASYGSSWSNGDIIGIAYNADDGELTFYKNNSSDGVAYSSLSGEFHFCWSDMGNNSNPAGVWNFGQDSSFAGNSTAQGNTDGNGQGDFYYAPPSGHLALCSANLPEPTIGPNSLTQADDHFDTVLRTGTGSEATVSLGFKPDFLWTKTRSNAVNHNIASSSLTYNYSFLQPNNNNAENTSASTYYMIPTSTGYTVGTGDNINQNTYTFVDWLWRANGGTTTTNDASATGVGSIDSVIQANTTAGFSIVTYTGSSSGTDGTPSTIAHGLGAVPKWIWFLPRDQYDGCVYHGSNTSAPATDRLLLKTSQSSDAAGATSDDSLFFNDTEPTTTVFSVGTRKHANSNGGMIAFVFADVEGFSKFGGYTGNDSSNGTFVYTGFKPAWIMLKYTSGSAGGTKNWIIYDNKRSPQNPNDNTVFANTNEAESADSSFDIDMLSNGFKLRNAEGPVNNAAEYIYMAFAEAPFKYANGV